MDQITFKRGKKEVTFKKVPTHFAIRLKQGRARNEASLEAACNVRAADVVHSHSAVSDGMEVFSMRKGVDLEGTTDKLRKAAQSDVVTHVYAMSEDAGPDSWMIPTGTMVIQFEQGVEKSAKDKILKDHGLQVLEKINYLDRAYSVRLTGSAKKNPLKIAADLQGHSEIVTAEPDFNFRVAFQHIPTDTLYPKQWHLDNRGDAGGLLEGADVKAEKAWDYTVGSRDISVCVMDDGFDLTHPDFDVPGKIVAPRDFGQDDTDPNPVYGSDNHGTSCAGVAIAEQNGTGCVGLAPGCSFMPVRMSSSLSDNDVVALFQHAIDFNADVISCSWHAATSYFPLSARIEGIIHQAAVNGRRNGKGCVILFAAGNGESPLDGEKDGVTYHQGFGLHGDVITVAASNSMDEHSSYSNYGPELTICAPSDGSGGWGVVTTDRRGRKGYSTGDYTYDFGGTSSSTPLAAGLAALILSLNPELSSAEVKQIMKDTADKIDPENGRYVDGHSTLYGHGRINAEKALAFVYGDDGTHAPEVLFMEHRINKPIPDLGEMGDSIVFPLGVSIKAIEVSVEIRHTYSGDLQVVLQPPNGNEIVLQDRSGGSGDDIVKRFRSENLPALFADIMGKPAEGNWKLKVKDMARDDVGVLAKWGLAITY